MIIKNALPTVLVLASGKGRRYREAGGTTHKLDALLAGKPVLEHTLDAVRASGLAWHLERQPLHGGMGDALAAAVAATWESEGWLVLPADMPLVLPATLRAVALALQAGASAAQPVVGGRPGHPVGFAAHQRESLRALAGDEGARLVLARLRETGQVVALPCDDAGALEDIDTPTDLRRAEALWRERQAGDLSA